MQESDAAAVAANTFRKVEWKVLRDELLRDGLVVQFGSMVSFAHHSFQEFLTARYLLEDLNGAHLSTYCDDYLRGSDWWQEVLCFYINFSFGLTVLIHISLGRLEQSKAEQTIQ